MEVPMSQELVRPADLEVRGLRQVPKRDLRYVNVLLLSPDGSVWGHCH